MCRLCSVDLPRSESLHLRRMLPSDSILIHYASDVELTLIYLLTVLHRIFLFEIPFSSYSILTSVCEHVHILIMKPIIKISFSKVMIFCLEISKQLGSWA